MQSEQVLQEQLNTQQQIYFMLYVQQSNGLDL